MTFSFPSTLAAFLALFSAFIYQCESKTECNPGIPSYITTQLQKTTHSTDTNDECQTYLSIHLKTSQVFPVSTFESEFYNANAFSDYFLAIANAACVTNILLNDSVIDFSYIRKISSQPTTISTTLNKTYNDSYIFVFGFDLDCNLLDRFKVDCCSNLYQWSKYSSFGPLLNQLSTGDLTNIWHYFRVQSSAAYAQEYQYIFENSSLSSPTSNPTQPPTSADIFCEFTTDYLSIICTLYPDIYISDSFITYDLSFGMSSILLLMKNVCFLFSDVYFFTRKIQ